MRLLLIGFFMTMINTKKCCANGKALRIALPVKEVQLDPHKFEDLYSMVIVGQIYAKLFKYTPDGKIIPDLVESWSVSKDHKTYTFKIKNMKFSDGTRIEAKHVEFSLKRIFVLKSALASDLSVIAGSKSYFDSNNINDLKIKSISSQELVIETGGPTAILLYLLASPDSGVLKLSSPMSDVTFGSDIVCSGVYCPIETSKDFILLSKWRTSEIESRNPPQKIIFNLFDKIDPRKIIQGNVSDTTSFIATDKYDKLFEQNINWRHVPSGATSERFVVLNPKKIPLVVRKWMLSRINTLDLVKEINDKLVEPAFGFIPNSLPGHLKSSEAQPAPDLKLREKIKFKIICSADMSYFRKFKSYLLKAWRHKNLEITFEPLSVSDYLKALFDKRGDAVIGLRGLDYPEGYSIVTYFRSNLDHNYFYINNKAIDQKIDQASHEINEVERYRLYEEIQKMVLDESTVVPLAFGSWKKFYWSKQVKDIPSHPMGAHFIPLEMLEMVAP